MVTRAKLLFATMTALLIGLAAGSAPAQGAESKSSFSKPSQQASLSTQPSEEMAKRAELRESQAKAAEEEKLRRRQEEIKLIEWARMERERKAAEEEKLRLARRQRAEETFGGAKAVCTIKPVMSDTEIEACRRAGR